MNIVRSTVLSLCMFSTMPVLADMPYINNNTADSRERIQKGEFVCETSKAQTTINAGVYGANESNGAGGSYSNYQYKNDDKGAYIGVSIPIGTDSKVDCSRLYDQVIRENDLKIKQLEMQVQLLQQRNLTIGK